MPIPAGQDPEELLRVGIDQATARLKIPFESVEEYVDFWRAHPAMLGQWNTDVETYARYDVNGEGNLWWCVVSSAAVAADLRDLTYDEQTRSAVDRVVAPMHLVRAEKGLFDDDPLLSDQIVDAFLAAHPTATIETVETANHYTLIFASPGPQRIAAAIRAAAPALSGRRGI